MTHTWLKDDGTIAYIGFNFDAKEDIKENISNIKFLRDNFDLPNGNQEIYILPHFHKGSFRICKYKSIESFLSNPNKELDEICPWDCGITTRDIGEIICSFQYAESSKILSRKELLNEDLLDGITRVISKDMRYKILKEQHWKCNNCHCTLKFNRYSEWGECVAEIDHIHPFADMNNYPNGAININERKNLQALCPKCNKTKHKNKN